MSSNPNNLSITRDTTQNIGSWIAGSVSAAGFLLTTASLWMGANKVASLDPSLVVASIGMVLGVAGSFVMSAKIGRAN